MHISDRLDDILKLCNENIYEALRYGEGNPKKGDYLDLSSKEGQVSYLAANRKPEGDPYEAINLRTSGKPVRIFKQFVPEQVDPWDTLETIDTSFNNFSPIKFSDYWERQRKMRTITDREWETFLYTFESYARTPDLKLVDGEDIRKYYLDANYNMEMKLPELQRSCMRHSNCQPYMDVYVYEKAVKMLVELDSAGKLMGRALVWTTDEGDTFMDRVYGNERTVKVFQKHAREQGWYHLQYNTYNNPMQVIDPKGKKVTKTMRVSIQKNYGQYPYMDTMKYLFWSQGNKYYLSNHHLDTTGRDSPYRERTLSGIHG